MFLPSQGDLDGRGEAGGEEVGGEVGVHGQQLASLACGQLDAVLHGGRQGQLGQGVVGVDGGHLDGQGESTAFHTRCVACIQSGPRRWRERPRDV